MSIEDFFAYARARHEVHIRREVLGEPRPWTTDPVLQTNRFTNVYRELDRTTVWLRRRVRTPLLEGGGHRGSELARRLLLATVVFRAFTRVETGESMFTQGLLSFCEAQTPFDHFFDTGDVSELRHAILLASPKGPWVTGAYMIRSPTGMTKLDGVLDNLRRFYYETNWRVWSASMIECGGTGSMRAVTEWLATAPGHGPFLAYEVVCDLRYTPLLENAKDRMTWANVGPGALRGLARVFGRRNDKPRKPRHALRVVVPDDQAQREMRSLLELSRDPAYWPYQSDYPEWEMREVEHTLCEFDKYMRAKTEGQGRMKRKFQ